MIKALADGRLSGAIWRYGLAAVAVVAAGIATAVLGGRLATPLAICAVLLALWIGAAQSRTAASLRLTREELEAKARALETAESAVQAEIAHRMRIEASLREGEARLGALAGSNGEIVFEFDGDGTYLNVWTLDERLLFRPREELIGRTLEDIFDEEWARQHIARLRRVLASGEPETWHYRIDLPTRRCWFLGRMNAMPSADGVRRTVACLVRDVTDERRHEQSRAAQHSVTQALADCESLAAAAPALLSAIGESMEWDWGTLWTVDREPPLLRCDVVWHATGWEAPEFDNVCRALAFKPGEGQPGYVWESGQAAWMQDVTADLAFVRRDAAGRAALRSGVALPILDLHGAARADGPPVVVPAFAPGAGTMEIAGPTFPTMSGEVLGVIEFFSRESREPDQEQLAMLNAIGSQIGQFVKRKRAEAEVRRSEKELRDVIETVPAMVWSALPDGSVDFVNRRWQEFTGRSDQSPGWDWQGVIHPDELQAYLSKWRASLTTGQPFEAEVRVRRAADGDYRWFTESAVPLRDEQGNIRKWYGVLADVEDRKRAEYLTRQVFESAPDGISVVGRDYRYQRVNPVYEHNWRMPAERIVGMHIADLLGAEVFAETIRPNLDRCFAGGEVRYARWFGLSEGRRYLSLSYSPLRPSSERVDAALVITRDLTDHALAAEALRAVQAELAHVNRVATMGQLTASIAHEVNQPIAAAVTNAQAGLRWLANRVPDLEEVKKALGRIIANGKRAAEVIARIRALIKRAPERQDRLDVNEAVLDVVALTGNEVLKHGVSLKTRLAEGLPPVMGDRVQLQQVLLNLILNALEAMSGQDTGARKLLIRTELDAGGGVLVSVRDTGPGLGAHSVDQLCEAFYTTKDSGLGMGLSISQSIVEAHGGRLFASANEPRGAVFQFTLPALDLRPASPEP